MDGNIIKMCCGNGYALILTSKQLYCFNDNSAIMEKNYFGKMNFDNVVDIATGCDFCIIQTTEGFYGVGNNSAGQIGYNHIYKHISHDVKWKIFSGIFPKNFIFEEYLFCCLFVGSMLGLAYMA